MKKFDAQFKEGLRTAVENVESTSGVELVVTIFPKTQKYLSVHLGLGAALSFLVLTLLMFVPQEFWFVLIYLETLTAFWAGFGLPFLIPGLKRMMIGEKRLRKSAETATRALFQQAGIANTRDRIGVLVSLCWLEKEVVILPDRGAEELVPPDEWATLQRRVEVVFESDNPAEELVEVVKETQSLFEQYIPRSEDDINELPDELWLH